MLVSSWVNIIKFSSLQIYIQDLIYYERSSVLFFLLGFVPTTSATAVDLPNRIHHKAMAFRKKNICKPKVIKISNTLQPR